MHSRELIIRPEERHKYTRLAVETTVHATSHNTGLKTLRALHAAMRVQRLQYYTHTHTQLQHYILSLLHITAHSMSLKLLFKSRSNTFYRICGISVSGCKTNDAEVAFFRC